MLGGTAASTSRSLWPKPIFDEKLLLEAVQERKINEKHVHKLWRYLLQKDCDDYRQIPGLSKKFVQLLDEEFVISTSKLIKRTDARDGSTTKLLIELQDGQRIESVIMRYGHVELDCFPEEEKAKLKKEDGMEFKSNKRATLCVSSQVGCAMACTFCATGTMGLLGNLKSGEILEQLYHASKIETIRGIVFMGMGEPLDNYQQVLSSIKGMTDTGRFGLAASRISISTVGVVPRIWSLVQDAPHVGLALSLHAPNQTLRTQIVPTTRAWSIEKIMAACDAFIHNQNATKTSSSRKRHILIEYVLIDNVNDSPQVAHELGALLQGREVLLNVIPYNPTDVPFDYKPPSREAQSIFVDICRNEYGVKTLLRQTMGQDVSAACGQLVIDSQKKSACSSNDDSKVKDLEDLIPQTKNIAQNVIRKRVTKRPLESTQTPLTSGSPQQSWVHIIFIILLLSLMMMLLLRAFLK